MNSASNQSNPDDGVLSKLSVYIKEYRFPIEPVIGMLRTVGLVMTRQIGPMRQKSAIKVRLENLKGR